MSKLDEFKNYLKTHQGLKTEVSSKKMTWQEIYENWTLSETDPYESFKDGTSKKEDTTKDKGDETTEDMVKTLLGYAKKINPDNVTKYVTSIQKVLELLQSFGSKSSISSVTKNTADPLFDRKFDDWY